MSEMKDFLTALVKNPEAKELLKGLKEPSGAEEAAELYADIAAKTGTSISKDAILAILKEKEAIQQARSAKAEGAVRQALEENDLESVAGGANPGCDDTHSPGEWCWFTDSCSFVISYYDSAENTDPFKPDEDEELENLKIERSASNEIFID